MKPYDRNGVPLSAYPETYQNSNLLGINGYGIVEYLRPTGEIFFVEIGEDGGPGPVDEYGPYHELSLSAFEWTLADYLDVARRERGEWRAITRDAAVALDR